MVGYVVLFVYCMVYFGYLCLEFCDLVCVFVYTCLIREGLFWMINLVIVVGFTCLLFVCVSCVVLFVFWLVDAFCVAD